MRKSLVSALMLSASIALPAAAQNQPQPVQPGADVAQQCLDDLQQFRARAQQEGYWLSGWGTRWGYGTAAVPPASTAPRGAVGAPAGTPTTGTFPMAGPWGASGIPATGIMSPRHQMRAIYGAAVVFAYRGNEQACRGLLAEVEEIYEETTAALEQAGIQPDEVVTWRQEQIVAAQDVTEVPWTISSDQIIGTEIRNAQDEYLGDIDDVVFDRETGELAYAIVAHGGFLGIGVDTVAVPWEMLQVTPGMNLFVLNVPESVVESAPEVDPDRFAEPVVYDEYRQTVDRYWQQHVPT